MTNTTILGALPTGNIVWPALLLEDKLLTWWIILAGLLLEFIFVWKGLKCRAAKAVLATCTANLFSTLAGMLLIPLSGILIEVILHIPHQLINSSFFMTFGLLAWIGTFILATLVNVTLEGWIYKLFKLPFYYFGKTFWYFAFANALSVAMAIYFLVISDF